MSSLAVEASLIVATFQLKAVQLIRSAIRVADLTGAEVAAGALIERDPLYAQRQVIHPEPQYLPAAQIVLRPHVLVEPTYSYRCDPCPVRPPDLTPPPQVIPVDRSPDTLPMQPPWKVLPWEIPSQPAPPVKVIRIKPDTISKGTLLDCFV